MTGEEAGRVIAMMNAGFPRESLEPTTIAIWVDEIQRLPNLEVALEAAHTIVRFGNRFPTLKDFRVTYFQTRDRMNAGREIEESFVPASPPPEAAEMRERLRMNTLLRDMP